MKTEHDDGTRGERRLKSDQGQGTQRVKPHGQSRLFTFVCLYNIPKKNWKIQTKYTWIIPKRVYVWPIIGIYSLNEMWSVHAHFEIRA